VDTSYFANLKRVANPLAICGRSPTWYLGPQFKVLAPKYDFFAAYKAGELDAAGYTLQFNEKVLKSLDPVEIYQRLVKQYGQDVSLLCYEKPGDFCHRRLVADWMSKANGVEIPERLNVDLDKRLVW